MRATPEPASYDEWSAAAVDYLSNAFPNPTRDGCPPREAILRAASSVDVVAGDVRAHLFQCSECFKDFRAARAAASSMQRLGAATIRINRRRTMLATAASMLLILGLGLVFRQELERLGRPRYSATAPAVVPSGAADATPSTTDNAQPSPERVRIALQPDLVRPGTPERA